MAGAKAPEKGTGHDTSKWEQAGELSRAIVRPVITVSGWVVVLFVILKKGMEFIDKDLTLTIVTFFLSSISMILGFYFGQRQAKKEE